MKLKSVLLALLFASQLAVAQQIGTWEIYSDMKKVKSAVLLSDLIYAATEGGAFSYNPADGSFKTFTKAEGLKSQFLTTIASDSKNRIWLGSQEGYLNVLDPADNSVQTIYDIYKTTKTKKQINDLFSSGDTVFVSTDFGLSLVSANSLSFYDSFLKLGSFTSEIPVKSAFKKNVIYVCTDAGVAVQKVGTQNLSVPDAWNNYSLGNQIPASSANRITSFGNLILLATSNGIFQYQNNAWQPFGLSGENVLDIKVSGSVIFALTDAQIYSYNGSGFTSLVVFSESSLPLNSILVKSQSEYFAATDKGLYESKSSSMKFPNGPEANQFVNLSVDPSGNLWAATGKNNAGLGAFRYDGSEWDVFNYQNTQNLTTNDIQNIYAGPDSSVYFLSWGRGLSVFKNGNVTTYNASNSDFIGIAADPNFVVIYDAAMDSKGNLWMTNFQTASRKPISVLTKDKKLYHYAFSSPAYTEDEWNQNIVVDQYDTKWFTIYNGTRGLYYFNENGTFTNTGDDTQGYIPGSSFLSDLITCLAVDNRGNLWVGTSQGINVINDVKNPKVSSSVAFSLRSQTITKIVVDPLDQKWVGTQQGVFVLSPDGLEILYSFDTKNSPLPSDDIKSIAIDAKRGIVYIGTDYGIATLTTASMQPVDSFSDIFVYPSPFVLDGSNVNLTIDGLVKNSSIKILNLNGNLINEIRSPGGRVAFWNGRDRDGNLVSSGVYILVAYDEEANNVATAKVAVIRK